MVLLLVPLRQDCRDVPRFPLQRSRPPLVASDANLKWVNDNAKQSYRPSCFDVVVDIEDILSTVILRPLLHAVIQYLKNAAWPLHLHHMAKDPHCTVTDDHSQCLPDSSPFMSAQV